MDDKTNSRRPPSTAKFGDAPDATVIAPNAVSKKFDSIGQARQRRSLVSRDRTIRVSYSQDAMRVQPIPISKERKFRKNLRVRAGAAVDHSRNHGAPKIKPAYADGKERRIKQILRRRVVAGKDADDRQLLEIAERLIALKTPTRLQLQLIANDVLGDNALSIRAVDMADINNELKK